MNSGVYVITNQANGKIYIGSALNLPRRKNGHFRDLRLGKHKNPLLQNSFQKHGESCFTFMVLLLCDPQHLIWFEQRAIDGYAASRGWRWIYNIGRVAGSRLGIPMSRENRVALSARMKGNRYSVGRKLSSEHRAKISAAGKGRKGKSGWRHSEHTKRLIGQKSAGNQYAKGAFRSDEFRAKISAATRGRVIPDHIRSRIAETLKGHAVSPETRSKIADSLRGKPLSPTTRAKVSASLLGNQRRLGIPHTADTKLRMSLVKTGKKKSPETRARMSAAQARREPPSQETRLKMSCSRKAYFERLRLEKEAAA